MRIQMRIGLCLLVGSWLLLPLLAGDGDARALLEKSMLAPKPKVYGAVYDMKYIDQNKKEKGRKAIFFFGTDPTDPLRESSLIYFLSPRDLQGSSSLTENYMAAGKDYSSKSWLFSPLFNKVKLNSTSNWRNRSFGSSMTVFDGLHHNLDWFTAKDLGEAKIGEHSTRKIELVIADKDVAERSGYNKLFRYIDPTTLITLKIEAFNSKDEIVRTFEFTPGKVGEFWMVLGMKVVQYRSDGKEEITLFDINHITTDLELDYASFFNNRTLQNGIPSDLQDKVTQSGK